MNIDAYLDESHGIHRYLMAQKAAGRIRHLGFSAHGSLGVIWRFLEAYGGDMEFCQLQLNYLDWTFQDGKAKVELLREWNIPVWVMEPLRGGQLARITPEEAAPLTALRPGETASSWAFRFLQSLPDVVVTLSGMSNLSQLKENIATFGEEKPLTPQEWEALMEVTQGMLGKYVLPCTACRYCVSHCPQGLDIPTLLALYNEHRLSGGGFIAPMALMAYPEEKKPSAAARRSVPSRLKLPRAWRISAKAWRDKVSCLNKKGASRQRREAPSLCLLCVINGTGLPNQMHFNLAGILHLVFNL